MTYFDRHGHAMKIVFLRRSRSGRYVLQWTDSKRTRTGAPNTLNRTMHAHVDGQADPSERVIPEAEV